MKEEEYIRQIDFLWKEKENLKNEIRRQNAVIDSYFKSTSLITNQLHEALREIERLRNNIDLDCGSY